MDEEEIEKNVLMNMVAVIVLIVSIFGTFSQSFLMWSMLLAFVGGFGYMYTLNRLFKGVFYGVPVEFLDQFRDERKLRQNRSKREKKTKKRKIRK